MELLELRMTTDLETAIPAKIGFNFDELKTSLAQRVEHYNHLVVTEDAIQDAKSDRANLRKLKDAFDSHRKEVKRKCMEPVNAFEAQVKELTALIDAPIAAIDGQIKAFEEHQRNEKFGEIEALYAELVPETIREIIHLNRILDPKWLNKNTSMKSIREAIETRVKRTNVDMALIDGVDIKYMTAVRSKYIATLDVTEALNERDKLMAAEEAFRQREAQRAAFQQLEAQRAESRPSVAERPPVAAQEPVREPAPIPRQDTRLHDLKLAFKLTQCQATALKQFLVENNIQYTKIV